MAQAKFKYALLFPPLFTVSGRMGILQTDREGRFFRPLKLNLSSRKNIVFRVREAGKEISREGIVKLPGPFSPGRLDIGDLILKEPGFVAAGLVLDERHRPLAKASVQGWIEKAIPKNTIIPWLAPPGTFFGPVYTGPDGSFTLRGDPKPGLLRIQVTREGWFQKDLCRVPLGKKDVKIVLTPKSSLEGSLVVDPEISLKALEINLGTQPGNLHGTAREDPAFFNFFRRFNSIIKASPKKDGTFRFDDLLPGTYTLSVRWESSARIFRRIKLFEIRGIRLFPGKKAEDPRLRKIDLRGKILAFKLIPLDEKGRPVSQVVLFYGKRSRKFLRFKPGERILLPSSAAGEALLGAKGFRVKKILIPPSSPRTHLFKGYLLRIFHSGRSPLPPPPIRLEVRLSPIDVRPFPRILPLVLPRDIQGCFNGEKGVTVRVPIPGLYRVNWILLWDRDLKDCPRGWKPFLYFSDKETKIQVRDTDEVQTFHVAPHPKALQEALKKMKG